MRKALLFRAKPTTEPTKYLVYYHNKAGHDDEERFVQSKHEFQVVVDPDNEVYECECKLWTRTGERKNKLIKYMVRMTVGTEQRTQ